MLHNFISNVTFIFLVDKLKIDGYRHLNYWGRREKINR